MEKSCHRENTSTCTKIVFLFVFICQNTICLTLQHNRKSVAEREKKSKLHKNCLLAIFIPQGNPQCRGCCKKHEVSKPGPGGPERRNQKDLLLVLPDLV